MMAFIVIAYGMSHSWLMVLPLALLMTAFIFTACRESFVAHESLVAHGAVAYNAHFVAHGASCRLRCF